MKDKTIYNIIIIFIALLGLSLSVISWYSVLNIENKSIISEFESDVEKRVSSFYREIQINLETQRSLSLLFLNDREPTFAEFTTVARELQSRHPEVKALEWIPVISNEKREFYETKMSNTFPGFEFTERKNQGVMIRAKNRKIYYPVYYIEPLIGNEEAFGFDLGSSSTRLNAINSSRDSAKLLATETITLVQGDTNQKGFLAFQPIYSQLSTTLESRQKNLKGFILGVYNIKDIFNSSALVGEPLGIDLILIDITDKSKETVILEHSSRTETQRNSSFEYTKNIPTFWSRSWQIKAYPTEKYIEDKSNIFHAIISFLVILFTFLIIVIITFVSRRAITVQKLVDEKTAQLHLAKNKLEMISRTDELTGVSNRREMNYFLDKEWLRATRNSTSIGFILIDIDDFKLFNDNYGHILGDECLTKVAKGLAACAQRSGDLVSRYGGEEFSIILTSDVDKIEFLAKKCCRYIKDMMIPHAYSRNDEFVTISCGFISYIPQRGNTPEELIEIADKALYKAKELGKNQAVEGIIQ